MKDAKIFATPGLSGAGVRASAGADAEPLQAAEAADAEKGGQSEESVVVNNVEYHEQNSTNGAAIKM